MEERDCGLDSGIHSTNSGIGIFQCPMSTTHSRTIGRGWDGTFVSKKKKQY
jgi:hypothetical protein